MTMALFACSSCGVRRQRGVRDDETGFGPIVRSTRVIEFDYLFGRFTRRVRGRVRGFAGVPLAICCSAR